MSVKSGNRNTPRRKPGCRGPGAKSQRTHHRDLRGWRRIPKDETPGPPSEVPLRSTGRWRAGTGKHDKGAGKEGGSVDREPGEGRAGSDTIRGAQTCMGSPSAARAGRIAWREQRQEHAAKGLAPRTSVCPRCSAVPGLPFREGGAGDHSPQATTRPAPEPAVVPNTSVAHAAGP